MYKYYRKIGREAIIFSVLSKQERREAEPDIRQKCKYIFLEMIPRNTSG